MESDNFLKIKSKQVRSEIVEMAYQAQKGHIASSFSIVEILIVLYYQFLKIDISKKEESDRFILSKGHACMALYAILADLGYFPKEELSLFCRFGGNLGGHPSRKVPGVEFSSGSLGHGSSIGVGMALTYKLEKKQNKIFVLVGDGECNEGSVWESFLAAHKHNLTNFWVIVDNNKFQSYGKTEDVSGLDNFTLKMKAFGFETRDVDMVNEPESLLKVLNELKDKPRPKCIVANTIKGMGTNSTVGNLQFHHIRSMSEGIKNKLLEEIENA